MKKEVYENYGFWLYVSEKNILSFQLLLQSSSVINICWCKKNIFLLQKMIKYYENICMAEKEIIV